MIKQYKEKETENKYDLKLYSLPKLHYENKVTPDLEINCNLEKKNNLYNNLPNFLLNIYIYKVENFKTIIPKNYFHIISIGADGNCFFRALSKFFSGSEENYKYFRNIVYNYIIKNKDLYKEHNIE